MVLVSTVIMTVTLVMFFRGSYSLQHVVEIFLSLCHLCQVVGNIRDRCGGRVFSKHILRVFHGCFDVCIHIFQVLQIGLGVRSRDFLKMFSYFQIFLRFLIHLLRSLGGWGWAACGRGVRGACRRGCRGLRGGRGLRSGRGLSRVIFLGAVDLGTVMSV
jgi:hypothetical protein